jgi:hypothetical protein
MSKGYKMRHCHLKRKTKDSTKLTASWLPDKFSKVGKYVKLKKEDGSWEDGWQVESASSFTKTSVEVSKRSQDYKNQRKASDI